MSMHRRYQKRKYAFGRLVFALRTRVSLSQTALANELGVHRRSFQNWETGAAYPKAATLQRLISVFVQYGAFTTGQEHEEAYALWKQAFEDGPYAGVEFDEVWFAALMGTPVASHQAKEPEPRNTQPTQHLGSPVSRVSSTDWGEAMAVPALYGREQELATLHQWVVQDRCRVVAVVGLGGIGKSSLGIRFAQQMRPVFQRVVFRSLHHGPLFEDVLDYTIRAVSDQHATPPEHVADKIALLVQRFREQRCLLILDNVEAILQPGALSGTYRTGYAEYGLLLRSLSERDHQSCLLLTSREKPAELSPYEGSTTPVRSLQVHGLHDAACRRLLNDKMVHGTWSDLAALTQLYGGNPLALQLVAEPIRELFDSDVGAFLATGTVFFTTVIQLLDQQFARSTALEQTIVRWLATSRALLSISDIQAQLIEPVSQRSVLGALESLRRRMVIERAAERPAFTLQPVILEYVTEQLVEIVAHEIAIGQPRVLVSHALVTATAKEYLRRSQERLIVTPLLERLGMALGSSDAVEHHLFQLLDRWRAQPPPHQGYGPGNVVNLLRLLRGDLRGVDLSHLVIKHAYLQNVAMQDANLSHTTVQTSSFTGNFDVTPAVAISSNGTYWATGSRRGDVHLWTANGQLLHRVWRAHMDYIPPAAMAFTPDERTLATAAQDGIVKVWDITTATLRWSGKHAGLTYHIVISPDGCVLATCSNGQVAEIVFWDVASGTRVLTLPHPCAVTAIRWSADGRWFAQSDIDGIIQVWQVQNGLPSTVVHTFTGHTGVIVRLAFAPSTARLASASWDGTVKLWDLDHGHQEHHLDRHTDRINSVSWSPDGRTIATSSSDRTIRLWDTQSASYHAVLHGHTAEVWSLAFTPDSGSLLSSSDDGTLRMWDVTDGQCVRVMHGHAVPLRDIDWSPDGTAIVSGGSDALITIWDLSSGTPQRTLQGGKSAMVSGVRWSPDGQQIVSSEWDSTLSLWDAPSGGLLQHVRTSNAAVNFFYNVAWRPDGQQLASGTFRQGVEIIDLPTQTHRWLGPPFPTFIQHVEWSPDGRHVAAGGDATLYVWDVADGVLLQQFAGHRNTVTAMAWSPDGTRVAAGNGSEGGGLFVWDVQRGECLHALTDHPGIVYAIVWVANNDVLITGGGDGLIRWWDVRRGTCLRVCAAHHGTVHALWISPDGTTLASCGDDGAISLWELETGAHVQTLRRDRPYERLDITGITGLTDAQHATLRTLGAIEAGSTR